MGLRGSGGKSAASTRLGWVKQSRWLEVGSYMKCKEDSVDRSSVRYLLGSPMLQVPNGCVVDCWPLDRHRSW